MARAITTSYSTEEREEIINHVLIELASGRPISRILREDENMPASSQFWRWIYAEGTPEQQDKLARARGDGMEALLDEALVIADDAEEEKAAVSKAKLQIETRIRMAQMLKPKTYSPKLDVTSNGETIGAAAQLQAARMRAIGSSEDPPRIADSSGQ